MRLDEALESKECMDAVLELIPTKYLVDELAKRDGVKYHYFVPYEPYTIEGVGSAIVIEIID